MLFYQGPDGTLQPTQTDANVMFGKGRWEQVDLPTDKSGYMKMYNNLVREQVNKTPQIAAVTAEGKPIGNAHLSPYADACPICLYRERGARTMADIHNTDTIIEAVEALPSLLHLEKINTALVRQVSKLTPAPHLNPPARIRARAN